MADDTVAAVEHLGIEKADFFGYSMGSDVALHVVVRHPDVVRKLVLASATYTLSGVQPGLMDGLAEMKPEMMVGSPWHEEYLQIAPRPEDFTVLFEKKTQMDRELTGFSAEAISAIKAPTLLIIGDSDLVRPRARGRDVPPAGGWRLRRHPGRPASLAAGCLTRHLSRDAGGPRRPAARDHPTISRRPCAARRVSPRRARGHGRVSEGPVSFRHRRSADKLGAPTA
jgi:pimeloyl-ACP methyl ester carboxylesterase